ncbi:hypothetical protein R84B8_01625 [Treponema sp. R8-4-B8]
MIYKKINNWSIFLTALVSYGIWYLINPVTIFNNNIFQLPLKIIISTVFSFGFFSIIVPVLNWLINKHKFIKRIFFGTNYIEGVWIGFFINKKGVALTIQQIEQTSDEVSVYGQTFKYNNGNPIYRSLFNSTGTSFDFNKHILYCTYISDKLDGVNAGFLNYHFINQEKKAPNMFWGYLSNYIYDGKMFFLCEKHCDIEKMPDLQSWIKTAKDFYESRKEYFKHIISDENAKKTIETAVADEAGTSGDLHAR